MVKVPHRLYLSEDEMPKQWYNLRADMKELPDPMINPGTMKPAAVEDLYPVFCEELAKQEMDNTTRYIDIPEEIQEMYKIYRPSPLIRAYNLEKALGTPAKIYYKFEGNNTSGSHKLNSAIAQAYYAKKQGMKGLTTETGAGQWGTALSEACSYFGIPLTVYMVKVSYEQKPFRKAVMQTFDAGVIASPSNTTNVGRQILAEDPDCRQPGVRDLGGGGKGGVHRGLPLCAGLGAEPGAAAPVYYRAGKQNRHGEAGGISRCGYWLRRRRLKPGRPDRSLYAG